MNYNKKFLNEIIKKLKKNNSRVSLFVEPNLNDIKESKELNSDCIEIHTGKICNMINEKKIIKKNSRKSKKLLNLQAIWV